MVQLDALVRMLGSSPDRPQVQTMLTLIGASKTVEPEIKAYPDVVYHNYNALGISLQYEASPPGQDASKAASDQLRLAAFDLYSAHENQQWTGCPGLPLQIEASRPGPRREEVEATITHNSTGKDLVSMLGEPQRKGGGAGGRSGPAAWMEWSLQVSFSDPNEDKNVTIQIELAGAAARGADRWNAERAGACHWAVITIS